MGTERLISLLKLNNVPCVFYNGLNNIINTIKSNQKSSSYTNSIYVHNTQLEIVSKVEIYLKDAFYEVAKHVIPIMYSVSQ